MKLLITVLVTITVFHRGNCDEEVRSPADLLAEATGQSTQIESPLELLQQATGSGSKNGHESNLAIDVKAPGNGVNQSNNLGSKMEELLQNALNGGKTSGDGKLSPLDLLNNAVGVSANGQRSPINGQADLSINDNGSGTAGQDPLELLTQALGQQGSSPPQTAEDLLIQQLLEEIRQNSLRLNSPRQELAPTMVQAPIAHPTESPFDRFPSMANPGSSIAINSGHQMGINQPGPTFPPMGNPQFGLNQNQVQPQYPNNNVQMGNNWNYQQPQQQFINPVYPSQYNPMQNQFVRPLSKHELHRMEKDERRAIRDMQRQQQRLAGYRF